MEVFQALADPVRSDIVSMLASTNMNVSEIAGHFPISRPAVSRHLSVLLRARLVSVREEAQTRVYSLDPSGLDEAERWLEKCRAIWTKRLDALDRHLDAMAKKKRKGKRR